MFKGKVEMPKKVSKPMGISDIYELRNSEKKKDVKR